MLASIQQYECTSTWLVCEIDWSGDEIFVVRISKSTLYKRSIINAVRLKAAIILNRLSEII